MEQRNLVIARKTATQDHRVQRQSVAPTSSPAHTLLGLQQSIGNQSIQQLISSPIIQAKLQISTPGDQSEQDADRVANSVMRMSEPSVSKQVVAQPLHSQITPLAQRATNRVDEDEEIVAPKSKSRIPVAVREDDEEEKPLVQRVCNECEEEMVHRADREEDEEALQRDAEAGAKSQTSNINHSTSESIGALNGRGSPLSEATRSFFEPRFGADFSQVRVHTDPQAAETARSINAKAFTVGRNIAFGSGQYAPHSHEGQKILAHELTHVVQQSGKVSPLVQRWGELEHKTVGNEAQIEFPYRGTIRVDMTALRESPRKSSADPYRNIKLDLLVGAKVLVVGKERAWLQIVVESGMARDKKGATVAADTMTGYVSKELITKSTDVFDQQLPIAGGLDLSYGDMVAMGGDHFKDLAQLMGETSTAAGRANLKKLRDLIDNEKTKSPDYTDPNTINKDYADRFKALAVENVSHFSLGGTSAFTWHVMHAEAIAAAFEAGSEGQTAGLARAYVVNGFADHFLTDSFSGGHVRVPRQSIIEYYKKLTVDLFQQIIDNISNRLGSRIFELLEQDYRRVRWFGDEGDRRRAVSDVRTRIMDTISKVGGAAKVQEEFGKYLAGAISKVLHDFDNDKGVSVVSKKHPEGWTAFGDGKLDVPANAKNLEYIKEAVKASKQDLVNTFRIGLSLWSKHGATPPQTAINAAMIEIFMKVGPPYEAWDFVPIPSPSATPLAGWEWGKLDQPTRTKLAELIVKYLDTKFQEEVLQQFPETEEVEVRGPNVDARPRDAARDILNELLRDPVGFLEMAFGKRASP